MIYNSNYFLPETEETENSVNGGLSSYDHSWLVIRERPGVSLTSGSPISQSIRQVTESVIHSTYFFINNFHRGMSDEQSTDSVNGGDGAVRREAAVTRDTLESHWWIERESKLMRAARAGDLETTRILLSTHELEPLNINAKGRRSERACGGDCSRSLAHAPKRTELQGNHAGPAAGLRFISRPTLGTLQWSRRL